MLIRLIQSANKVRSAFSCHRYVSSVLYENFTWFYTSSSEHDWVSLKKKSFYCLFFCLGARWMTELQLDLVCKVSQSFHRRRQRCWFSDFLFFFLNDFLRFISVNSRSIMWPRNTETQNSTEAYNINTSRFTYNDNIYPFKWELIRLCVWLTNIVRSFTLSLFPLHSTISNKQWKFKTAKPIYCVSKRRIV